MTALLLLQLLRHPELKLPVLAGEPYQISEVVSDAPAIYKFFPYLKAFRPERERLQFGILLRAPWGSSLDAERVFYVTTDPSVEVRTEKAAVAALHRLDHLLPGEPKENPTLRRDLVAFSKKAQAALAFDQSLIQTLIDREVQRAKAGNDS